MEKLIFTDEDYSSFLTNCTENVFSYLFFVFVFMIKYGVIYLVASPFYLSEWSGSAKLRYKKKKTQSKLFHKLTSASVPSGITKLL